MHTLCLLLDNNLRFSHYLFWTIVITIQSFGKMLLLTKWQNNMKSSMRKSWRRKENFDCSTSQLSTSLVSANKIEKGFCSKLGLLKMNCEKTKENLIGCNLNTVHRLMILLFPHGKQKSFELPANPGLLKNAPRISDSVSHPSTEA